MPKISAGRGGGGGGGGEQNAYQKYAKSCSCSMSDRICKETVNAGVRTAVHQIMLNTAAD